MKSVPKQRLVFAGGLIGAAFLGALVANLVSAQQSRPEIPSNLDRTAIEQIVRDTIRNDPEIIVEALNLYSENHVRDTVRKYLPEFLSNDTGYVAGKNIGAAKVAVVEFFDYHCGFCKRGADFVQQLAENDPKVKVAFREYPILREESEIASRYALAARAQGKYTEFHFALLRENGLLDETRLKEVAARVGLDVKKLERDQAASDFARILDEDRRIGQELGIDGTPTFIVATTDGEFVEIIPGFRPEDVKAAIAEAKKRS
jgi:protein-disulfide isomerase